MYVFIRERNSDLFANASKTDTFFQISNISIQFQNKNGLLASASMQQLYEMSARNHCAMNYTQWSGGPVFNRDFNTSGGTIGGVICIEFATDIGMASLEAPGILSQSMLQVQVQAKNVSGRDINPTLYIVTVMEGTFTIQGLGQASTNVGVITAKDVLDCRNNPIISYADVEAVNGGDFFSGLKSFGSKLNNFLKRTKLISTGLSMIPHPAGKVGSTIVDALGYGEGGVLVGGKQMSRAQMRKRLHQY
jgi:hypothetical protein